MHIIKIRRESLLSKVLRKYELLLNEELGHWKTEPVDLEWKDLNTKSINQKCIQYLNQNNQNWN